MIYIAFFYPQCHLEKCIACLKHKNPMLFMQVMYEDNLLKWQTVINAT